MPAAMSAETTPICDLCRAREARWYRLGALVVCWRCVFVAQGRKPSPPPLSETSKPASVWEDENNY